MIKTGIVIPLAFFSIFGLFIECFTFGYLNQSIHTPENERLTFYNYLIPLLLTFGFIIYFTREQILSKSYKEERNFNFILAAIVITCAFWAIPWQIRHIEWLIERNNPFLIEWIPIITAILFTIGSVIIQIRNFKIKYYNHKLN